MSNIKIIDVDDGILINVYKFKILFTNKNKDAKKSLDVDEICSKYGFNQNNILYNNQVHSSDVRVIKKENLKIEKNNIEDADALVTDIKKTPLLTFTADCVPIVLLDTKKEIIANIHAGWRGSYGNIVGKSIEKLLEIYSTQPSDLIAVIGPSINICCYEVGEDLIHKFSKLLESLGYLDVVKSCYEFRNGKYYLSLWKINEILLKSKGVKKENIFLLEICTSCNSNKFFSYRKHEKTKSRIGTFVQID